MLIDGLRLMALGMTMVFIFLTFLVLLMYGSARFFRLFGMYFPEPAADAAGPHGMASTARGADEGARVAAAVAAIHAHRRRRG
jgi:oxaloacetate decarboxylase (Na+ extruding) subunit gamma